MKAIDQHIRLNAPIFGASLIAKVADKKQTHWTHCQDLFQLRKNASPAPRKAGDFQQWLAQ